MRALIATLAIQVYVALVAAAVPVLATEVARDLHIAPTWVGVFSGLVYAGAMGSALVSGAFVRRYGAIRVSQTSVAICAAATASVALLHGTTAYAIALAALVMGVGYGAVTPASSHLLARTTPPERMSLVFSLKQSGVPGGTALAGAVLPSLAGAVGWREGCALAAAFGLTVVIGAQTIREGLDDDRQPGAAITATNVAGPLRVVFAHRRLRELALVSVAFVAVQVSLTSFLVVYLTDALRWHLVTAGLALTAATTGGVVGRIGWGAVADRLGKPRRILAWIGLVSGMCAVLFALATPSWPTALIVALAAVFGACAIGWNGVTLAEIARQAPTGQVGAVTGAATFVTFAGVVVGPPMFAMLSAGTGTYRTGFAVAAAASFLGAVALAREP